mmetsp:Transcript_5601/g.14224  ORF Transcript_5601/g.14224 Transcript_5601/m.14224 type:complete len:224 (-) Transcript_5601:139-810(-)
MAIVSKWNRRWDLPGSRTATNGTCLGAWWLHCCGLGSCWPGERNLPNTRPTPERAHTSLGVPDTRGRLLVRNKRYPPHPPVVVVVVAVVVGGFLPLVLVLVLAVGVPEMPPCHPFEWFATTDKCHEFAVRRWCTIRPPFRCDWQWTRRVVVNLGRGWSRCCHRRCRFLAREFAGPPKREQLQLRLSSRGRAFREFWCVRHCHVHRHLHRHWLLEQRGVILLAN